MADKKKVELTDLPEEKKLNEEEEKSVKGGALLSTGSISTLEKSSTLTKTSPTMTSPTNLTMSKSSLLGMERAEEDEIPNPLKM